MRTTRHTVHLVRAVAVAAVAFTTMSCGLLGDLVAADGTTAAMTSTGLSTGTSGDIAALLRTLPVRGRAPMTGYDRDAFGPAWTDDTDTLWGHNGCDTRSDILRRDLADVTIKPNTHDCVPLSGQLNDPYTGAVLMFTRGSDTSSLVQIDHVVALGDAWQSGAQQIDPAERVAMANDPLNLLAVDGPTNQQKSDSNAASWLPSNKTYWCAYVSRQIAVKAKYGL